MRLARFIAPIDTRVVFALLCGLLRLQGAVLLVPLAVALLTRDLAVAAIFAATASGSYLIGRFATPEAEVEPGPREGLVVTALGYLLFAVFGALPFLPVAPPLDGLFESMSGYTTTGLSVMDADSLPRSLLFFRSYAQWIGGAGIAVLSLVVLLGPGRAAFQLYASEFGQENVIGSVVAMARVVVRVYMLLTAAAVLAYIVVGMPAFDALVHAFSSVSTGGFSARGGGLSAYGATAPRVAPLFMLLGAVSFPLYHQLRVQGVGPLFSDLQLRYLIGIVLGAGLLVLVLSGGPAALPPGSAIFQVISAATTTGFALVDFSDWRDGTRVTVILLMLVGGSAGSTAGGIKLFRLILLVRMAGWLVVRSSLPREARVPVRYGELAVSGRELREMLGFLALYAGLLIASTLALVLAGYGGFAALFESVSALGTVGLSAGVAGPDLIDPAKLVLILDMWAGRLEILPVLVILYPRTWLRGGRSS